MSAATASAVNKNMDLYNKITIRYKILNIKSGSLSAHLAEHLTTAFWADGEPAHYLLNEARFLS